MPFPPVPEFVRNDPFGPRGHNNILQRQDYLYSILGVEHDPVTGEHNTPNVARTLGCVKFSGGVYTLEGFNADLISIANPAVGTVTLTLNSGRYDYVNGIIETQAASANGTGAPSLVTATFTSDTVLSLYMKEQSGGLGIQQNIVNTDMSVFVGVRSPKFTRAGLAAGTATPPRRLRGDGLAADSSNWNPMVQRMGENRYATLIAHTEAGLHNVREVTKAWGYLKWDSTSSSYAATSHQGFGAGVSRLGTGAVRVYLANAAPSIVAPVQAFASAISAATLSTDPTGLRVAVVPYATCLAASVDVYLYESYVNINHAVSPAVYEYRWRAVDGDVFVRVHGT